MINNYQQAEIIGKSKYRTINARQPGEIHGHAS